MDITQWQDDYRMIHVNPGENSDNGLLFTVEYYILKMLDGSFNFQDKADFVNMIHAHRRDTGRYWQRPDAVGENPGSHDNLTALTSLAHKLRIPEFYENVACDSKIVNPRDVIFYNYLKDKWWARSLIWYTCESMRYTCEKPPEDTSGKLLAFVRLFCIETPVMAEYKEKCTNILKETYQSDTPWSEVFKVYFKHPEHPCRILSQKLSI